MLKLKAQDRSDPAKAKEVVDSIFESSPQAAKRSYLEFFGLAIDYLSQRHLDRWGVTLFPWGVRLNTGRVECLVLHSEGVRVLVERNSVPTRTVFERRTYPTASGCGMASIPLSELPRALRPLLNSHYAALSIAAKRDTTPSVRSAHSPGIPAFLSDVLRRRIPNPEYEYLDEPAATEVQGAAPVSLADTCVYTIITPENLQKAARGVRPIRERKPWATASTLLNEARAKRQKVAVIFGDARQTTGLLAWSTIKSVVLKDKLTEFTVGPLYDLGPARRRDFIVRSTGQPIPAGHRKPYVICKTPRLLTTLARKPKLLPRRETDNSSGLPRPPIEDVDFLEMSAPEGRPRLVSHFRLERNRALIQAKKRSVLFAGGSVACEVCGFDFDKTYDALAQGFCEVHHLNPLSRSKRERVTNLHDLAIVCSNCHRMLHRKVPLISVDELRLIVAETAKKRPRAKASLLNGRESAALTG